MSYFDYTETLDKCEEVKNKLDELSKLLFSSVNQGLSNNFELKKHDLINWIEEIEFEINSFQNINIENYLFSLTERDIQYEAVKVLNRKLTETELENVKENIDLKLSIEAIQKVIFDSIKNRNE